MIEYIEFTCKQCGKTFRRSTASVRSQVSHFGTKPQFCCNECKNAYMTNRRTVTPETIRERMQYGNYDLQPLYDWMINRNIGESYARTSVYTIIKVLQNGNSLESMIDNEDGLEDIIIDVIKTHSRKSIGKYKGCIRNVGWYVSLHGIDTLKKAIA